MSEEPPAPRLLWGRLVDGSGLDGEGFVRVAGGRIEAVERGEPTACARGDVEEVLGGPESTIAPGFCDLQVNGYGGIDCVDGPEAIAAIAAHLPAAGITGFCPTVITGPLDRLVAAPAQAATAARASGPRARIRGIHQEGPFLSPDKKGAHDPAQLRAPDPASIDRVIAAGPRILTIAPELPGALEAIARLAEAGIVVSIGHSNASEEVARAAIRAGARMATHLFNAMSALAHRAPGVPGAVLTTPGVTAGLIADGQHVAAAVLAIAAGMKGAAGIALTSDAVAAAGAPPGRYRLGTQVVHSDGSRITLEDGVTLAGSLATTDVLVRVMA
ncbi:MAG: N-acetylglucosamine-6-phosphate deacetylase, partial [Solirubrobacteraceae bacterium]